MSVSAPSCRGSRTSFSIRSHNVRASVSTASLSPRAMRSASARSRARRLSFLSRLARALGEAFEQCFVVDAFERRESQLRRGIAGDAFGEQRRARDALERRAAQRCIGRGASDMLDQRGIVLRAQQSCAFDRRRCARMRAGQQLEPELARVGANARVGIVLRETLRRAQDRRDASSPRCARRDPNPDARCSRRVAMSSASSSSATPARRTAGFLGLPARLVEKSGQLHRRTSVSGCVRTGS